MKYPNLRAEMARRGMKQKDLANLLGVTEATVSRWLAGSRAMKLEEAKKVANELNERLDYLFAD